MNLKEILSQFVNGWVQATSEQFTNHPIATLFRQDFKEEIEKIVKQNFGSFEIKASVGAGNWANVAWLSILNPAITSTTQDGIYPVYLFNADGSGFYLSLMQGATIPTKNLGKRKAEQRANEIKQILLTQLPELAQWGEQDIDLKATTILGQSYEKSNISAKFYASSAIPENDELIANLNELLQIYKKIDGFNFEEFVETEIETAAPDLSNPTPPLIEKAALSKPFLLLAGISGTGKTRFVRKQAEASGQLDETYCLTSVRPDWHEPSDLLGYISRLNGDAEYITTDVLQFIAKAWRGIADQGLTIEIQAISGQGKRLVVTGEKEDLESILPYWLCLDEMNLAPVEQYFADYLSVLETREWQWDGDQFTYSSDALLKPATINEVANKAKLRQALGFENAAYDELWALICQYGLSLPFNLIVAGTVNMDETTHGFSRKVIDRALSFDFGEFFPNDYQAFFSPTSHNKCLSYPIWSQVTQADLTHTVDSDGLKTIALLTAVNTVLQNTPFELAYRALNELLLAVASEQPQDELTLTAVWDDFMMCKVLPRIEGDCDKLVTNDGSDLLTQLNGVLEAQFASIWQVGSQGNGATRPDLHREKIVDPSLTNVDKTLMIPCRSKAKLSWMQQRLASATFTSFWP